MLECIGGRACIALNVFSFNFVLGLFSSVHYITYYYCRLVLCCIRRRGISLLCTGEVATGRRVLLCRVCGPADRVGEDKKLFCFVARSSLAAPMPCARVSPNAM